jgi:hypothetical protein
LLLLLQVPGTGQDALYITGRVADVTQVLLELRFVRATTGIDVSYKSERQDLVDPVVDVLQRALA